MEYASPDILVHAVLTLMLILLIGLAAMPIKPVAVALQEPGVEIHSTPLPAYLVGSRDYRDHLPFTWSSERWLGH